MVTDHSISFASTIAWLLTGLSFIVFVAAIALRFFKLDDAAFAAVTAFMAAVAGAGVAHVRTYFCHQNQLLRQIIAAQRATADQELRSV